MRETTAISVTGDRKYVNAINCLARDRGITVGDLVRKILDQAYGDEIQGIMSFFEKGAASKQQTSASDTHTS